jgi:hypothetical protein
VHSSCSTIVVVSLATLLVLLFALSLLNLCSENGGFFTSLLLCGIALLQSFLDGSLSLLFSQLGSRLCLRWLILSLLLTLFLLILLLFLSLTCSGSTFLALFSLGLAFGLGLGFRSCSSEEYLKLLKFALFLLFLG